MFTRFFWFFRIFRFFRALGSSSIRLGLCYFLGFIQSGFFLGFLLVYTYRHFGYVLMADGGVALTILLQYWVVPILHWWHENLALAEPAGHGLLHILAAAPADPRLAPAWPQEPSSLAPGSPWQCLALALAVAPLPHARHAGQPGTHEGATVTLTLGPAPLAPA